MELKELQELIGDLMMKNLKRKRLATKMMGMSKLATKMMRTSMKVYMVCK